MSDLREQIRQAIVTKVSASAGITAAGLRQCDTRTDDRMVLPALKVLRPYLSGDILRPNANLDEYDLLYPAELLMARPVGKARVSASITLILEAIKVEWRSGLTLGLAPTVSWSWFLPGIEELSDYADTEYDGARVEFQVHVTEIFNPGRSA